jgi:dihydroxyacid dehydratase/phosphogluconate dehydratase
MEDFYYAGGLPAVLRLLGEREQLHREAMTVTGQTIWENVKGAPVFDADVIRPADNPIVASGGLAVLRGNLAPRGAVLKPSAASPHLMTHRGPAIVFDSIEEYKERIADPDLPATADSILVLRNCGPKGYPGMAEVGNMGLPPKLLKQGVTDMVRISDARMSGTAYGTVILHVAPEAAAGGPLALVRDGDIIAVDVPNRRLHLEIDPAEIERRLADWRPPPLPMQGGYQALYVETVLQADQGADLSFLVGCRGHATPRPSH